VDQKTNPALLLQYLWFLLTDLTVFVIVVRNEQHTLWNKNYHMILMSLLHLVFLGSRCIILYYFIKCC